MAASILKSPHNPSIWEVEVKRATSLRPAWATQPEKGKERRGEEGWAKYTMPSDKSPAARPSQPAPPPPQPLDPVHGILNRKGENTTFWNSCPFSSGYFFFSFILIIAMHCFHIFNSFSRSQKENKRSIQNALANTVNNY